MLELRHPCRPPRGTPHPPVSQPDSAQARVEDYTTPPKTLQTVRFHCCMQKMGVCLGKHRARRDQVMAAQFARVCTAACAAFFASTTTHAAKPAEPLTSTVAIHERTGANIATLDVSGIPSMDGLGSANNRIEFLWIGPGNAVNGIGWDVVLETILPSS